MSDYNAELLTANRDTALYFEAAFAEGESDAAKAAVLANWLSTKAIFDKWIAKEGFKPIRLIGVATSQFDQTPQMGLFENTTTNKHAAIDQATDSIVEKFGKHAIRRAGAMRKED